MLETVFVCPSSALLKKRGYAKFMTTVPAAGWAVMTAFTYSGSFFMYFSRKTNLTEVAVHIQGFKFLL